MFPMIDESKCDEENYLLTKSLKKTLFTLFKREQAKASKRKVIDNV